MITSPNTRMDYEGNNSASSFAFTYPIVAASDIVAIVRNEATGVETTLVLTTDYTVPSAGIGVGAGGTIALVNAAQAWLDGAGHLATGYHLTILRVRPVTQLTDIRNQGDFYPEVHEDTFDNCRMIDAQITEALSRCVSLAKSQASSGFSTLLPVLVANQVIVVNGAGNGLTGMTVAALLALSGAITEGATGSRPANPPTAMFYFDTTVEQMFYYSLAKAKWYPAF